MRNRTSFTRIVMCILILCVILTGCSRVNKSGVIENSSSTANKADETFDSKLPSNPKTALPTQNSIPSELRISPSCGPTISPMIKPSMSLPQELFSLEVFKDVLQNKVYFYSTEDNKNLILDNYIKSFGNAEFDEYFEITNFALLDMDGDDSSEVILKISFEGRDDIDFIEVLHYMNGTVYGYLKSNRQLGEPKSDGTFISSGGAGDYRVAKLRFTLNNCEEDILGYCVSNNIGQEYFINNKPASNKLFDSFINKQIEKKDVEWFKFSQEIIKTKLSSN